MEDEPRERLRREVRALGRHELAASSESEDVLDAGRADEECRIGLAAVDRRRRVVHPPGVADPVEAQTFDELRVQLAVGAPDELDPARPVGDGRRLLARLPVERGERLGEPRHLLSARLLREIRPLGEDAMGGEDVEARVVDRDDEGHHARPLAEFATELDGALVAVVAVGDEQLAGVDRRRSVDTPETRGVDLEIGSALGNLEVERVGGEEEQRLRLHARRAQEREALLADALVRLLVGADATCRVRLGK